MSLAEEAFHTLYPNKESEYDFSIKYSNKFKPYNANIRLYRYKNRIELNLSKKWKTISKEIQIGLIQSLLLKLLGGKKTTQNIELYNIFMKKIHIAIPKTKSDPILEASFNRVNEKYFYNIIDKPNLVWGSNSYSKLGSYEYGTDTITISNIFKDTDTQLLDYIMYHEMLHKKHKFKIKNGRSYHHTSLFRKKEKEFEGSIEIEKQLKRFRPKKRRLFRWL